MAEYEEMSDSDESFDIDIEHEPNLSEEESEEKPKGIRPDQYEPILIKDRRNEEERRNENRPTSPTDQPQIADQRMEGRLSMPVSEWCTCGCYTLMPTEKECICCKEVGKMVEKIEKHGNGQEVCITYLQGFQSVCLDECVLECAYYQYDQQYGHIMEESTERNRYTAYRQLARWGWKILGRHVRVVLPSCAVNAIRKKFPSADDEYTGFSFA